MDRGVNAPESLASVASGTATPCGGLPSCKHVGDTDPLDASATPYLSIQRVPLAEAWRLRPGCPEKRYVPSISPGEEARGSDRELASVLYDGIAAAVERSSRGATRIGVMLSGGLDSSSVLLTLERLRRSGRIPAAAEAYSWEFDTPDRNDVAPIVARWSVGSEDPPLQSFHGRGYVRSPCAGARRGPMCRCSVRPLARFGRSGAPPRCRPDTDGCGGRQCLGRATSALRRIGTTGEICWRHPQGLCARRGQQHVVLVEDPSICRAPGRGIYASIAYPGEPPSRRSSPHVRLDRAPRRRMAPPEPRYDVATGGNSRFIARGAICRTSPHALSGKNCCHSLSAGGGYSLSPRRALVRRRLVAPRCNVSPARVDGGQLDSRSLARIHDRRSPGGGADAPLESLLGSGSRRDGRSCRGFWSLRGSRALRRLGDLGLIDPKRFRVHFDRIALDPLATGWWTVWPALAVEEFLRQYDEGWAA